MKATRISAVLLGVGAVSVLKLVACGGEGFAPASKVDSVRLFAVRADKPYAAPGQNVTLEALMTDARKAKPRPANVYWIPVVCLNPTDDLYYGCFVPPSDAGTAGGARLIPVGAAAGAGTATAAASGGGGPFGNLPTGVDLGPFLPKGPTFSFQMPDTAIQPRRGSDPYGLAFVFNVVCAGRLEFASRDLEGGPQQVPILCTDENGTKLPPSDYVIGISRVYSYADAKHVNANPVIEKATLEGAEINLKEGVTLERCTASLERDCKENKIDVRVSDASWELNPAEVTRNGALHEQIWVDYYSDIGALDSEARLLFDTQKGRISDSDVKFRAPKDVADGTIWAVVHDNRGGVAWVVVPLHVR
jgi:hypothetical protein